MLKLFVYFLFFVIVAYEVVADANIIIKPISEVDTPGDVTIGEIAIFKSVDKSIKKKLSKIVLSNAPKFGEKRVYPQKTILMALKAYEKKINLPEKLKYKVPLYVTVLSKGSTFNKENVIKSLSAEWKGSCSDCTFRFTSLTLPAIPVTTPVVSWVFEPSQKIPRGNFASKVVIAFENGAESKFWVTGQVKLYKKVPVFKRAIGVGERVKEEDIIWKDKDVTFTYDSIPELTRVYGKQLIRSVRLNEIVYQNLIKREKTLKRGELVKVISNSNGWEISISGVAQQDGYDGDTVNVKNVKTNKLISGTVTGKGEVTLR